ncbi:MAG: energy transducer TonB [Bacteroidales bacterium]|nr:energy transducer TonB [Bacteroidales bacterium]
MRKNILFRSMICFMLLAVLLLNSQYAHAQSEELDGDTEIYRVCQVMASFPGGQSELYYWLASHTNYPVEARDKMIQGTVLVEFVIEKDGSIGKIDVISSVHELLDAEAVRVIQSMPKWNPAQRDGKACRCYFDIPFTFALENDTEKPAKRKKGKH